MARDARGPRRLARPTFKRSVSKVSFKIGYRKAVDGTFGLVYQITWIRYDSAQSLRRR